MKPDFLNDDSSEQLPPGLSGMKRENPFKVPDGYFDSLPGDIMKRIEAVSELDRMSKENPFNVPEGYFDSLPAAVQQRISDEKKGRSSSAGLIFTLTRPKYLAAAVLVVLLIFGIKYLTRPVVLPSPKYLTYEEVQNSSCIGDIDESDFVDAFELEQNNTSSADEDAGIKQYLLDNNIDISQIENHL